MGGGHFHISRKVDVVTPDQRSPSLIIRTFVTTSIAQGLRAQPLGAAQGQSAVPTLRRYAPVARAQTPISPGALHPSLADGRVA
jgi:hypothetical protein